MAEVRFVSKPVAPPWNDSSKNLARDWHFFFAPNPKSSRAKGPANKRRLVRLIGPILLVAVVWRLDDKAALWSAVKEVNPLLFMFALLLNVPAIHLKIVRWRGVLAARGFRYPLARSSSAVLSPLYLGMLTPGRVGEVLRIQYVKREIHAP
jgi:hypothetical protein